MRLVVREPMQKSIFSPERAHGNQCSPTRCHKKNLDFATTAPAVIAQSMDIWQPGDFSNVICGAALARTHVWTLRLEMLVQGFMGSQEFMVPGGAITIIEMHALGKRFPKAGIH